MLPTVANAIDKVTRPISMWVNGIGTVTLVAMVVLTVVDVTGRAFFNSPLLGIIDIQQFLLLVLIFLAIAYCQFEKRHVRVTILTARFPQSIRAIIDSGTYILGIFVFAIVVWQTIRYGRLVWEQGMTGGILGWPAPPFVFTITLGCALLTLVLFSDLLRTVDWILTNKRKLWPFLILSIAISLGLITLPMWLQWEIGTIGAGLIGLGFLVVLLLLGTPVGFAMAFIGLIGMAYLKGLPPALNVMGSTYFVNLGYYVFAVIPFFLLMGLLLASAGVGRDLYDTTYAWVGHRSGGISMATVAACGGFAAICGDSLPTGVTMGTVALPEMKRFKYDDSLATGCVAAGGTLGILIPPSIGFILYAIITEESIGKLFIAGIIPGILLMSLFMLTIYVRCRLNPKLGPPGPRTTFKEKIISLKGTWVMIALFLLVIGGLYLGIFTPTEAGAIGAFAALIIGLATRRFTRKSLITSFLDSGAISSMLFIILGGVFIMGYFLAVSRVPLVVSDFVAGLQVSRYLILVLILFIYVILGMLMNIGPMILLTLPIFFPTVAALGFDPIWFGVIMVIMMEMGQITPPIGINVFAIAGVARDVPMWTIFKGIFPFVGCQALMIAILILFPQIATWLPSLMWE